LTFIATEKAWEPAGLFKNHLFLSFELPTPDLMLRTQLWTDLSVGYDPVAPEVNWGALATKFRLTPGQMQDALIAASNYTYLRAGETSTITMEDLYKGCRAQSNQKLTALARKLSPRYSWEDITLTPNALAQLCEVCIQVKHRQTVYGVWGFGDKLSLGKGLCVLFYGPSGTGKTMAVEVIANELHLEAYKIDLSTVVSKYIGETEKNLSKIFQEAETSNAILFFDEADALFGKRSEVKDAHDRYANIEINYLLQRMEEFEGLVILATNLRKNIDDAFFRRMHFAIEFPFPSEGYRYRIWKQHFPKAAPVADDIDFNFLANRFNIAGGNIKNIVVHAAFLAAENSGVIHMEHLIRATRREYEKIGRMCTETEFAPYQTFLKE
jgi:SpoVK/Ycf46/Vps4 family AAA+-type ATPase